MLGLAARRRSNGNLTVVSPKDGIEFDINEDLLNINMIELGNFCRVEVENNKPVSFSLVENEEVGNFTVKVDKKGFTEISEVLGVLKSKLALFYETEEFGDVACKDENPGKVGTKHKIVISRLPENQRIGVYSKYVWQGVSIGLYVKSSTNIENGVKTLNINDKGKGTKVLKEEEKGDDASNNEITTTTSESTLSKYITGFVTGHNLKKNTCYVSCNLTYPGVDGIVYCSESRQLKVGDWIEVRFSDTDFEKYFPPTPTENTPRFTFIHFTKISQPKNYSVKMIDKIPEVKIKNFRLPAGHKKGDNIEDRFLGTVSDGNKLISGDSVDLVIRRRKIFKSKNEKFTTWFIKGSKKSSVRSESTDTARSSSTENRISKKKSEKNDNSNKKKDKKETSKKSESNQQQQGQSGGVPILTPLNWQLGHSGPMPPYGAMPLPFNPVPPYYFPRQFVQKNLIPTTSSQLNQRKGFKKPNETEEGFVAKRAVVTSVKPNKSKQGGKDSIAFLWLLDDHISSVYYFSTSREPNTTPGHFFEGSFYDSGERWECMKYVRSLGKLMDGIINNDSIELQLTITQYYPQSQDRLNPETHHSFIGKIIDKHNKLPKDCSSGVKISIKVSRLNERNEYCWVVSKVYQSKHIQLLMEFHQAWRKPEIRNMIRLKCVKQFGEIRELLDIALEGEISRVHSQFKKEKPERLDDQKQLNSNKFAWVTVQDDDFIRMVVFPRNDGQKMSGMKKLVTDKKVYQNVERMEVQKLYSVRLNEQGDVIEMFDCPQYLSAKSNGEIEFKLICCDQTLLAKNVAVVEPIGVPDWIGKLMFCSGRPISNKKLLMRAKFRLLKDGDLFADDEVVCDNRVCFMSCGDVDSSEILSNQNLENVLRDENRDIDRRVSKHGHNLFKAKIESLTKDIIIQKFKSVCQILTNKDVIEAMEDKNINTEKLLRLRSSALD